MRERLVFKVYGSNEPEMKKQALAQIESFMTVPVDLNNVQIEIEYQEFDAGENLQYVGIVHAKLK